MIDYSAIALDVGGVIYYDEPFEQAWLQGTFDRISAIDRNVNLQRFLECTERFYLREEGALPEGTSILHSEQSAQSWAQVRRAWRELAQEIPGAVHATAMIAAEYPTAIVANQPPECAEVLAAWGLTSKLDAVLLDSLVGMSKPDPRLLELALARLDVRPTQLLVVGNRIDHDVTPARSLGCPVAFVLADPHYRRPYGVHPEIARLHAQLRSSKTTPPPSGASLMIVSSLAELIALGTKIGSIGPRTVEVAVTKRLKEECRCEDAGQR